MTDRDKQAEADAFQHEHPALYRVLLILIWAVLITAAVIAAVTAAKLAWILVESVWSNVW